MLQVGILVFPQVEELDFVAPFEVMSYINKLLPLSTQVRIVANKLVPIKAFNGLTILPDTDFAQCPLLDVLIVPGGKGRLTAMHDPAIRQFVLAQSAKAQYVASVCTGAFILAEAGLLSGKQATTYHTALDELAAYGNIQVKKRKVVQDGQVITAAGVSSGLELGFYLLGRLFSPEAAQAVADKIEYQIVAEKLLTDA